MFTSFWEFLGLDPKTLFYQPRELKLNSVIIIIVIIRSMPGFLPYSDVEDVGADRAGNSHVSETFTGHDDAGDEIWDGGSSCQDRQSHDLLCDADGLADLPKNVTLKQYVFYME